MKMKVLHVLTSPHIGGAEQVCLDLASELKARGADVHIFFLIEGKVSERAKIAGIPSTVELSGTERLSRFQRRRLGAAGLLRTIQSLRPTVVHSHVPLAHLICSRVLPRTPVPWVATIHGSWRQFAYGPGTVGRPYLRPYLLFRHALGDRFTTRSAARVIAVSDYVRRDLIAIGVPPTKITTILNGLPPTVAVARENARSRMGIGADALVIGALGYFAPVKGFDILLRAFAVVRSRVPKAELLIAGGDIMGDARPRLALERLLARLDLGSQVRLLGPIEDLGSFYSALDVFVVSSRTEGLPLALIQAMQHGCACVVSSSGGSAEVARPDQEALVFHSGDPLSLAHSLERLLLNAGLRKELGRAAALRASESLTLKRCTDEYEKLYESVAACERDGGRIS